MSETRIRVNFNGNYPMTNVNCSRLPTLHATKGCPWPGIAVEIVTLLTSYLNLTIEVQAGDRFSTISDMFEATKNSDTDLVAAVFSNSSLRADRFDFTDELYLAYPIIAVRKTDRSLKNLLSFFNVYCSDAWLSMLGVFILFTFFGFIVRYIEISLKLRSTKNYDEILWKMTRFQLVQAEGINYKLIAGRSSLLVFCLFQVCIILGLFQGFILTSVVRKTHVAPFTINDNIPQMVKDGKLTILSVTEDDWFMEQIKNSSESPYYELREAIKYNPYKALETDDEMLQEADKGNGGIIFMLEDYVDRFKAESYCNIIHVDSPMPPSRARFMFRKDSPFLAPFNKAIRANKHKIEMLRRKYLVHKPPSKCPTENNGPAALTMTPFFGLFIFFFVGISLSFFAFSCEILKWRIFGKVACKKDAKSDGACKKQKITPKINAAQPLLKAVDGDVAKIMLEVAGLPPDSDVFIRERRK